MKNLSYKFANILVKNDIIENDDFEIYRYGFEVLLYFLLNIFIAFFIGIILDKFIHTIIFLSCYCTLRQFTGGYHAKNYIECALSFAIIYLITIFTANHIDTYNHKFLLILFMTISTLIIYKLAPLEHRNKPLTQNEKRIYKARSITIVSVISAIFLVSITFNIFVNYFVYSLLAVIWISTLLVLGKFLNQK